MIRRLRTFPGLAAALLLAGCAHTVAELPAELKPELAKGEVGLPAGAVVSIRYPMIGTPAARRTLVDRYICGYNDLIGHPMGGCPLSSSGWTGEYAPMLFDQSTYYAAELRRMMGRYVDERAVRLEPMVVDYLDGDFRLTPALRAFSPSVLVVDLYDFQSAVVAGVGPIFMPKVGMRTASDASPETCGNLLASSGHFKFEKSAVENCAGKDARAVPGIMPLRYFSENPPEAVPLPARSDKPVAPGAVRVTGALIQWHEKAYLQESAQPEHKADAETIRNDLADVIARVAVDALRRIDMAKAFDAGFASYAESYDPGLAGRLRAGQAQPADARRLEVLRKLLQVENDWLANQNEVITEGILNGGYGKSFRQTRVLLAETRRKNQTASWLMAGATLASGFSSGLFAGGAAYNPMSLMTQTLQNQAMHDQTLDQIQQATLAAVAPAAEIRAQVVEASVEGIRVKLQGETDGEIHAQLQKIYDRLAAGKP